MTKELLREFEVTEKLSISYFAILILYFLSTIIAILFSYKSFVTVSGRLIPLTPEIFFRLIFTFILPIIILFLFVAKKKIGWFLIIFNSLLFEFTFAKFLFKNIDALLSKLTIATYFFLNSLVILILLLTPSLLRIFKIHKREIIYTVLVSLIGAVLFQLF